LRFDIGIRGRFSTKVKKGAGAPADISKFCLLSKLFTSRVFSFKYGKTDKKSAQEWALNWVLIKPALGLCVIVRRIGLNKEKYNEQSRYEKPRNAIY
jgi:hypothetical protein